MAFICVLSSHLIPTCNANIVLWSYLKNRDMGRIWFLLVRQPAAVGVVGYATTPPTAVIAGAHEGEYTGDAWGSPLHACLLDTGIDPWRLALATASLPTAQRIADRLLLVIAHPCGLVANIGAFGREGRAIPRSRLGPLVEEHPHLAARESRRQLRDP